MASKRATVPARVRPAPRPRWTTATRAPSTYGRWEHEGIATWDGQRFAFTTTHFSTRDPIAMGGDGPDPDGGGGCGDNPGDGPGGCGGGGFGNVGSSANLLGGSLRQDFALPTYRAKNESFGLTLEYQSGLAASRTLGDAPTNYSAVEHGSFNVAVRPTRFEAAWVPAGATASKNLMSQPGVCTAQGSNAAFGQSSPIPLVATRSLAGSSVAQSVSVGLSNAEAEFGSFVNLPLTGSEVPGSGLYRARTVLTAQTPGSCIAGGSTFGVSDGSATTAQTSLESGPLGTMDEHVLVHHRLSSPYGAGWHIRELSRVYRSGDFAELVNGSGATEVFRPRAHAVTVTSDIAGVPSRDERTGEVFIARNDGRINRIDPLTGASTTVVAGIPVGSTPIHDFAIGYAGTSRRFLMALEGSLVEVDGAGTVTTLKSRTPLATYAQAHVVAHGDAVFYTDAVTPVLYTVSLSDPARTVTALSQATGGDQRLYPRATLSGTTIADPRGLSVSADGVLYLTDLRRNGVYAIHPDTTGKIGSSSVVDLVVGDGGASLVAPRGERYPGTTLSVREPLAVSVADAGTVFIATTYGIVSYDPVAREAEWLFLYGGTDELTVDPTTKRVTILGLSDSSILTSVSPSWVVRFDVDRLSSQFDPTRTLQRLGGGLLELVDTTANIVHRYDATGRLIQRRKRTGEVIMDVTYADTRSDRVDHITDAAGGQLTFSYDGAGKLQSITDPRGGTTSVSINGLGDLVGFTDPAGEAHGFTYDQHRMVEKRSPRNDKTTYTYRADGTLQTATRPEGGTSTVDAALSHAPTFDSQGKVTRHATYVNDHGVSHDIILDRRNQNISDTYVTDGVTRVEMVTYGGKMQDVSGTNGATSLLDINSGRLNKILRISSRSVNGVSLNVPITFDAHGRFFRQTRGAEASDVDRRWYDASGWLLEEFRTVSNTSERYERDTAGHVTGIFDISPGLPQSPTGRERRWTYRTDGLVATSTEHGVTRTYTYDDAGGTLNETSWTDTLGRSMTFGLDLRGNVARTSDGTATTFASYDAKN